MVLDQQGFAVADFRIRNEGAAERNTPLNQANAAFTIQACNAYDKQKEALELVQAFASRHPDTLPLVIVKAVKAALGQ